MNKKNFALLGGASTLALATLISGSFAAETAQSTKMKVNRSQKSPSVSNSDENAIPVLTSSTSKTALRKTPVVKATGNNGNQEHTDAIVTSAASANSLDSSRNTLDMSVGNPASGPLRNFTASYGGVYYGPSVKHLDSANQPSDQVGDSGPGGRIFVRNALAVGYKPTANLLVGAVARVDYMPTHNKDYAWADSYVRVMAPKLVDRGNFSMVGDLRLYLPTSAYMRTKFGESYSVATRLTSNYNIPHSRLSIGAVGSSQYYVLNEKAVAGSSYNHELYAGPNMAFQATPTLAFSVLYELDAVHRYGDPTFTYTSDTHAGTGYTDLEPGVSWDITPNVNVNPFLNMYPGSNFSLETTNINVVLGIKML